MKTIKKRYTIRAIWTVVLLGISILVYSNYKTNTRINQLEEVIELQERQIEVLNQSNQALVNEIETLESTIEYINEQNAQ